LCNTAHAYITRLNLAPGSRLLQFFAYSFDGSVGDIFPALTAGATLYLPPQVVLLSPTDLHRYLQTHAITHILMTPSLLRVLPTDNLPALRVVLGGGEQLTRAVAARWLSGRQRPALRLVNGYGPTEATVVSLFHLCDDIADLPETAVSVPIGRPADNTQVYILDPHQQPVPIGVPGELYIAGAGVAHGYLNQPQLTAERFVSLPLTDHSSPMTVYRTGDRCRWRPDGTVEFLGRLDHQVKLRGFRIELEEVEAALTRCVGVETAVVTLHQSETRQQLAAYFTSPQNPPPTAQTLHQQLLEQLPAYMIPTSFIRLAALPRLPNGKIDRRALPAPSGHQDERVTSSYTAPGTPNEALLCAIWAELLSLEKVGIHDNFFALGGDSILTIQLVARARQAGLQLTPRQIFQFPTIAQLASQVGTVQLQPAEQGLVTGEAPLTPVQRWFFEQAFAEADHWNQALMLKLRQPLRLDWLETAVSHLIHHHDALRLRYTPSAAGWQQTHADDSCRHLVQAIDLSHLAPAAQKAELEEAANRLHASLNLQTGPLLRLLYCHLGPNQPDRLLLTIHHLVIDSLSWRILLEDLQQLYQQIKVGKPVELPPKTTSFKQWANELTTYARSADLGEEVAYWLALAEKERPSPLPHDFPFSADANLVENGRRFSSTLSAQETEALLHDVPPIYGTQINDILLTALVEAVYRTTGSRELWLALEGHGREDMLPGIDLSRTVGWFTAIFPVYLSLQGANSPGDAIKQIKEQCRRIPDHGIGYGLLRYLHPDAAVRQQLAALATPEISFNYLGQLDQSLDDLPFEPSQEAAGHAVSPRGHRPHLLAVNGAVFGGQLQLEWTYCHNVHRAETVGQLANQYMAALRELIAHCQQPTAGGYTPSDFPEVALSTADLDALLVEFSD
jgi:non-ribosomal peptide synthase protein (TIGR01720 family)